MGIWHPFLRPKPSKNGGIYNNHATCSMRLEGGPLGKPHPKGCGPLPLPKGQANVHFGWAG